MYPTLLRHHKNSLIALNYKAIIAVKAFFCLIALVFSTSAEATVIFEDNFEYEDSPLDHGWTVVPGQGTATDFTTQSGLKPGERHLHIDRTGSNLTGMSLLYDLGSLDVTSGKFEITVDYFADLQGGTNHERQFQILYDDPDYFAPPHYSTFSAYNNGGFSPNYHYNLNPGGQFYTDVERTFGWAQYKAIIEDGMVDMYIDDMLIADNAISVDTLEFVVLQVGEPNTGNYDNISVKSVPAPAGAGILILGLIALLAASRRRQFTSLKRAMLLVRSCH